MFAAFRQRLGRSANRLRSSRHFAFCKKAAAAVEFGLVAAPFLALLIALFQTALVFFAGRVLDVTTHAGEPLHPDRAGAKLEYDAGRLRDLCLQQHFRALQLQQFHDQRADTTAAFASATTSAPTLTFNQQGSGNQYVDLFAGRPERHRGCPGDVSMAGRPRPARLQSLESLERQSAVDVDRRLQERALLMTLAGTIADLRSRLRRFARDRKAISAVEFAIILPFMVFRISAAPSWETAWRSTSR